MRTGHERLYLKGTGVRGSMRRAMNANTCKGQVLEGVCDVLCTPAPARDRRRVMSAAPARDRCDMEYATCQVRPRLQGLAAD